MKLYHCPDARSLRPLWALEEMGLECELENMRFPPRFTYPDYLDINPMGTVPTFLDGDLTMTESSGICHYLVERYGPSDIGVYSDEPAYGEYLNWLYRSDATLTFPQTIVLRYTHQEPEKGLHQAAEDYAIWYHSRLRAVEAALEGKEYLVADRFTIADIAVGYALFLGISLGLDERYKPNCKRYLARLMERDGFNRARARQ
ncbi:MAG: glutathione S-transferase family protein [Pseudomonadales bacterium]|jgi:glutathione S-transferase|nr:glutathione S-transferase family protein [Pseudomonadales bacterium]MDP6472778.1 glutathione S-transferase family protein [Pseudomonadales bacterium]MDP6827991.1 glutathione S-transferase family protein [Pseudomonadales bacterium]MDP6972890.1 glutathione S-transferase family protein [Pseudomonadales bacterium]|tara:strand:- start:18 stop:623 length:606 start_codon:yes stop_codon:yes gene_type:complete